MLRSLSWSSRWRWSRSIRGRPPGGSSRDAARAARQPSISPAADFPTGPVAARTQRHLPRGVRPAASRPFAVAEAVLNERGRSLRDAGLTRPAPAPEKGELSDVPADLNQTFSGVREPLRRTPSSAPRRSADPGFPTTATPRQVMAEFISRDKQGNIDRMMEYASSPRPPPSARPRPSDYRPSARPRPGGAESLLLRDPRRDRRRRHAAERQPRQQRGGLPSP